MIREKFGLAEESARALNAAGALLDRYDLPYSRARYYVRRSSWHRFHGQQDSFALYADLALWEGKRSGRVNAVGDGALLYAAANRRDTLGVLQRYYDAVEVIGKSDQRKLYTTYRIMLARSLSRYGRQEEAGQITQELMASLDRGDLPFYDDVFMLGQLYDVHASYQEWAGRPYAALATMRNGHRYQYDLFQRQLEQRVQETEDRHALEQQAEQLAAQEEDLIAQQRRQRWFAVGSAALTLVCMLLGSLLLRLRKARKRLGEQASSLQSANKDLERSLDKQTALRAELHHRVKNNLQVVMSILDIQEDRAIHPDAKGTLRSTAERVFGIAAMHEMLNGTQRENHLELDRYLRRLCTHSARLWPEGKRPDFRLDVGEYVFNLDTLMPLGVMVCELLMNTQKSFLGRGLLHEPRVAIELRPDRKGTFRLIYSDNGPGFPDEKMTERPGGMGTYLVHSMARQLRGTVKTYNREGAVTEINFRTKGEGNFR